jgi:UPF0755 protein
MVLRILGVLLLVVLLSSVGLIVMSGSPTDAALLVVNNTIGQPVSPSAAPVHLVVRTGETASTLGDELAASHVIRSSLAFRAVVRLRGLGSTIEAGDYELKPSTNVSAIATAFAVGHVVGGQVTIPEGWRALEIADALDRAGVTSRADFLAAVAKPSLDPGSTLAIPPGHSLEGFLYPDTYRFDANSDPTAVVKRLIANFAAHLSPDVQDGFAANQLDLNSAVTLASIVEREAVIPSERPTIASVYLNRLHRGMRLQADPTVQYALVTGDGLDVGASGYWKRRLTSSDLLFTSPYNTYIATGFPPGPICNPGAASLAAVAHPATTDFLYFVARPDGTHAFARTLAEHEKNVATFQQSGGTP